MSNFTDLTNMSARFDELLREEARTDVRISVSSKHHIFASITRLGLFKTGGIAIKLVSLSQSGALFNSAHHSFPKSLGKDVLVEISLNGKHFKHEARVVRQDTINNLYGIKFSQSLEALDDYLSELNIPHHYGMNAPRSSSVWLEIPA